tara:strand:+ start:115 stop:636 length:522 start_codon:yes stop_codon:yes gene_type:complete
MVKTKTITEGKLLFSKKGVTKILREGFYFWSPADYELYKKFSELNEYCVKVTDFVDSQTFTMEKLDIVDDVHHLLETPYYKHFVDDELIFNIIHTWARVYADCISFSKQNLPPNQYFLHGDMTLENMVVTTDKKVKLLDPNAFKTHEKFLTTKYLGNYSRIIISAMMYSKVYI